MTSSQGLPNQIAPSRFLLLPIELQDNIYETVFQSGLVRPFSRELERDSSSSILHTCAKVYNRAWQTMIEKGLFAIDIGMNDFRILGHPMGQSLDFQTIACNLVEYEDLRRLAIMITWDYRAALPAIGTDHNREAAANRIESLMKNVCCVMECFQDLEYVAVSFVTSQETRIWGLPGALRVRDFLQPLEMYKLGKSNPHIDVCNLWGITGQKRQKGEKDHKSLSECVTALAYQSRRELV